jgi:hypothetical protein
MDTGRVTRITKTVFTTHENYSTCESIMDGFVPKAYI